MKGHQFLAAVAAGAVAGVGGFATVAFAAPSHVVEPSVDGGHVHVKAGVWEQTGETEYYRKIVNVDVSAAGAVVDYEAYDSNFYETIEEHDRITVSRTGVTRVHTIDRYGPSEGSSDATTVVAVDPAQGVVVSDRTSSDGCETGPSVSYRPIKAPLKPVVVNDEDC
jgi:hypothetical protein